MPKISKQTSIIRKLRKGSLPPHHKYNLRSSPAHHVYNLRSKSRRISETCRICGIGSVNKHGNCKGKQRDLNLKKRSLQHHKKLRRVSPCVICLDTEEFKRNRKVKCGHEFHIKCINSWLKISDSCPICRFQLRKPNLNLVRRLTLRVAPYLQFHFF